MLRLVARSVPPVLLIFLLCNLEALRTDILESHSKALMTRRRSPTCNWQDVHKGLDGVDLLESHVGPGLVPEKGS